MNDSLSIYIYIRVYIYIYTIYLYGTHGTHGAQGGYRVGRAPAATHPGGATETMTETLDTTATNIPTPTTPHAPAPRNELSRSGHHNHLFQTIHI